MSRASCGVSVSVPCTCHASERNCGSQPNERARESSLSGLHGVIARRPQARRASPATPCPAPRAHCPRPPQPRKAPPLPPGAASPVKCPRPQPPPWRSRQALCGEHEFERPATWAGLGRATFHREGGLSWHLFLIVSKLDLLCIMRNSFYLRTPSLEHARPPTGPAGNRLRRAQSRSRGISPRVTRLQHCLDLLSA